MTRSRLHAICLPFVLLVVFGGASPAVVLAQDAPGSKDHPMIKRYQGSRITGYEAREFDAADLPLGKALGQGEKYQKVQRVEGKRTSILYENPAKRSVLEVFRNYESALKSAGFETLFACADADCGLGGPSFELAGLIWAAGYGQRHLTAKLSRAEGDVYVSLHVQGRNPELTHAWLTIVEAKPMETGLVKVDAAALANDLARTGHVAIYGIYFDFGKADVKPESDPTLKEISKLLQQNPQLKLHVVGHTDSVGELAYNVELSRRRANAVVQVLTAKHGIAAARLRGDGVGPLSPVASNRSEEGRAKNRRVELVEQ